MPSSPKSSARAASTATRGPFGRIYKDDFGDRYLAEAADYARRRHRLRARHLHLHLQTHGRFPAHCEAIHVPGIWIQMHHVEIDVL